MSMSLKFAMPLLSTLAAMVIIVNSAEEMDNYNRHEMRARALDRDTGGDMDSYEQPWRTMDAESGVQQTTPINPWKDSAEDPPRRRRLGRKRKRRPQYTPSDDTIPRERYIYHEEQLKPYPEYVGNGETTNVARRRHLPIDWSDEADEQRGQRGLRRRPKYSEGPQDYHKESFEEQPQEGKQEFTQIHIASAEEPVLRQPYNEKHSDAPFIESEIKIIDEPEQNDHKTNIRPLLNDFTDTTTQDMSDLKNENTDDRSLSDFSSEIYSPILRPRMTYSLKELEPYTPKDKNDLDKAQSNPTSPLSLKELLKRSKGKSLSEILQQRNLTLSDLLQGKINALSLLKSERSTSVASNNEEINDNMQHPNSDPREKAIHEETVEPPIIENIEHNNTSYPEDTKSDTKTPPTTTSINIIEDIAGDDMLLRNTRGNITNVVARLPRISTKRRFQPGIRRKLRMKPSINSLSKAELSRELVALAGRKYLNRRHRNITKMSEWKDILPKMMNHSVEQVEPEEIKVEINLPSVEIDITKPDEEVQTTTPTTTQVYIIADEIFTQTETDEIETTTETTTETESPENGYPTTTTTTTTSTTPSTTTTITTASPRARATEKAAVGSLNRTINNGTALRWQAFNNRMKKKRMRQKNLSDVQKDINIFAIDNLKPASEFVAKTQAPGTTIADKFTEEFVTSELLNGQETGARKARLSTAQFKPTTSKTFAPLSTTEKTAKFEIEEILKDTRTSSTLSKILIERNMTLSELFDHRERGSSHVHLADIFHNASKEPSAPEPFLSKSLIEPISKETYPLRAILEANQHDPSVKTTTNDPVIGQNRYLSIPIVLDFGNNVNENGENMGIMALFDNLTKTENLNEEEKRIKMDSQGSLYKSSVLLADVNDTNRLSRDYKFNGESARWGDVLNMLKKTIPNETTLYENDISKDSSSASESFRKPSIEDVDGDGLIILEDLQRLDNKISSILNETIITDAVTETDNDVGILNKPHNTAKSVTVATASIIGLAMVLFLLTYALFKWNQQRIMLNKKQNFAEQHIPTPVFEKRKISKLSNSSRSISPMLSCNIYTMDTLESSNGKDSPEYMWDNLRKPFQ